VAKPQRKLRYTPEQIDKSLANERLKLLAGGIVAFFLGVSAFALAMTPLAKAVAGTDTNFNLNISLAFNLTLALSTGAGATGCYALNKRRRYHMKRVRRLEGQLTALKKQLDGKK